MSFIFGGKTGLTYEQAKKQREQAELALAMSRRMAQTPGEGLAQIGLAIEGVVGDGRADRAEREGRETADKQTQALVDALMRGPAVNDAAFYREAPAPAGLPGPRMAAPAAPTPSPAAQRASDRSLIGGGLRESFAPQMRIGAPAGAGPRMQTPSPVSAMAQPASIQASPEERDLLARMMLAEASPRAGLQAMADVGHVAVNRVGAPGYQQTLADVIMARDQFTGMTGPHSMRHDPGRLDPSNPRHAMALQAAEGVLAGTIPDETGEALNYYSPAGMNTAEYVAHNGRGGAPSWADGQTPTLQRHGHVFLNPRASGIPGGMAGLGAAANVAMALMAQQGATQGGGYRDLPATPADARAQQRRDLEGRMEWAEGPTAQTGPGTMTNFGTGADYPIVEDQRPQYAIPQPGADMAAPAPLSPVAPVRMGPGRQVLGGNPQVTPQQPPAPQPAPQPAPPAPATAPAPRNELVEALMRPQGLALSPQAESYNAGLQQRMARPAPQPAPEAGAPRQELVSALMAVLNNPYASGAHPLAEAVLERELRGGGGGGAPAEPFTLRPGEVRYQPDGRGGYVPIEGPPPLPRGGAAGAAPRPPTEAAVKARAYLAQAEPAYRRIRGLLEGGYEGPGLLEDVAAGMSFLPLFGPLLDKAQSGETQEYRNALETLSQMVLRLETGAAQTNPEIAAKLRGLEFSSMDPPQVTRAKLEQLDAVMQSLRTAAQMDEQQQAPQEPELSDDEAIKLLGEP